MCIPVDSTFLFKLIVKRNRCLDKVIFSLEAFFFFLNHSSVVLKLDDTWSSNV